VPRVAELELADAADEHVADRQVEESPEHVHRRRREGVRRPWGLAERKRKTRYDRGLPPLLSFSPSRTAVLFGEPAGASGMRQFRSVSLDSPSSVAIPSQLTPSSCRDAANATIRALSSGEYRLPRSGRCFATAARTRHTC
jgi:hypothetical protein